MTKVWILGAFASLALACGGGGGSADAPGEPDAPLPDVEAPSIEDSFASGTRLKVLRVGTEDGTFVPTGEFLDTELGVRCTFQRTDGDVWRCVPSVLPGHDASDFRGTYLAPGCNGTRVIDLTATCGATPPFLGESTSCGRLSGLRSMGPVHELATGDMTYFGSTSVCTAIPTEGERTYVELGDALPLERLATGVVVHSAGRRLKRMLVESPDGARAYVGVYDTERGGHCLVDDTVDGVRCLPPVGAHLSSSFADPSCAEPVAEWSSACEATPHNIRDSVWAECGWTAARIHEVGARADELFATDGECSPAAPNRGSSYYTLGAEIPLTAFTSVSIQRRAAGSLDLESFVADGMTLRYVWRDPTTEATCVGVPDRDGQLRCMPGADAYLYLDLYSDPACEVPWLVGIAAPNRPCSHSGYALAEVASCPRQYSVYRVAPIAPPQSIWRRYKGECVPSPFPPEQTFMVEAIELISPDVLPRMVVE